MKLNKLNDNGQMPIHLGGAVLCVALLGVAWSMGLGPLLTQSNESSAMTHQHEQVQGESRASSESLKQLQARLDAVRQQLDRQPVNLEPSSEINRLMAELAGWSDANRLVVTRTQAGRPVALPYYDYVPISLSGEGGYLDLLQFFRRIYEGRGDLGVVSFSATSMGESGGVLFQIELAWYVVSDDSDLVDTPTASVNVE